MIQHISVRVPWHDHGWDGTICQDPCGNTSCLKLKGILESKNENAEEAIKGEQISVHIDEIPCLSEGAAFMSPEPYVSIVKHPYSNYDYPEYKHFLPTENVYPPYSLVARPFAWLLKKSAREINEKYNLEIDVDSEENWPRGKNWLQFGESHQAVFDYFYKDVIDNKSLCLIYAKQVPFVEETGRVIIGIGHVKNISPAVEHKHTNAGKLKSMLWETHIAHSIRDDHKDGFLIPYEKLLEYSKDHPEFDMKSVCVMAPSDSITEFSYATEHVSYDSVIEVLLSCRKAFEIINNVLDDDYSNVIGWIDERLNEVWDERGAFPGLGSMFCAIKVKRGILVAKEIQDKYKDNKDFWSIIDKIFENPSDYLSDSIAKNINEITKIVWRQMPDDDRELFKLLSRFDLTIEQAETLFNNSSRIREGINFSNTDIIKNPYILYEATRLKRNDLVISVKKIDRAVFPVESVRNAFPISLPTALDSDNDKRRIRALAIYALEESAENGNTILPLNHLIKHMQNIPLSPECAVTDGHINSIESFISDEIVSNTMKDGGKYFKLKRLEDIDKEIKRKIEKKLQKGRIDISANWRKVLDNYLLRMGVDNAKEDWDERAREEKSIVLKELAESRVSILVGDAGTGKTTVLAALCSHQDIIDGGVLLLAPTGKATVRLLEAMGGVTSRFDAFNVAQFLTPIGGFSFDDMRYKLPDKDIPKKYETVIIDESSMLTEEMFGSLMKAIGASKRIIFVGDPNQLPPIGAGRPFVDLCNLLKQDFGGKLPRVKNGYCELVENCRQASSGERLDVEFAKMFTTSNYDIDRDVIKEILQGNGENISLIQWSGKDDLENKLFKVLDDEFGINDQKSFDESLGGNRTHDKYSYFNCDCSPNVDKWQILSPVKNMPQGVLNLNHLIHSKFRAEGLSLSRNMPKHIASPWGHENIIYGDKVINVRNINMTSYPKNVGRNYIANGEIGICCGDWKKKREMNDNSLQVEFSSQKNCHYFYNFKNFNDEAGTNDLELAYALTVHKSQGSQFDTVILVLAEPCRILSKEMLYTSLTRQKQKIVILYNSDPHKLFEYTSPANSDIAQRFTDLFAGMMNAEMVECRPNIVKVGNKFYEDGLIHRTKAGELVRSKSEVIIANCLTDKNLSFQYEPEIKVGDRTFRPDFIVYDPDDDEDFWYWEHLGMPTDPKYMTRWEEKKEYYKSHGIIENKNLIVTSDGIDGSFDSQKIDEIISGLF